MGQQQSTPTPPRHITAAMDMSNNDKTNNNNLKNNNNNNMEGCPVMGTQQQQQQQYDDDNNNACPTGYRHPEQYNVYGERIDPSNRMPVNPNQYPYPGQHSPLPTDRVSSSIPKGGTDGTWLYPSQQMFYNALKRKGKGDDIDEEDMQHVLAVHNGTNERSWRAVLEWEACHRRSCPDPRLLRFQGRPDAVSPKARLKHWLLGYPLPFDRHDWYVDRCGIKVVRYVIDYYYNEHAEGGRIDDDGFLHANQIDIDARPALDDLGNIVDRVLFPIRRPTPSSSSSSLSSSSTNDDFAA